MGICDENDRYSYNDWQVIMINVKSIHELDVKGKKVLCRFDFNVPIKEGVIEDDRRLREALPTIQYLIEKGAKIIMTSHLGRPKGKRTKELTLLPVAKKLSELLGKEVKFVDEVVGDKVTREVEGLGNGELLLLENVRFHPGEEANDPEFAGELASPASIYVNDAFGTAHRKHTSTYGVAKIIKEKAAGFLMEKEIKNLSKLRENPPSPFTLILGGAKLKTKIPVIKDLASLVDNLLVGGGMAFSFLYKKGIDVGDSLLDESLFDDIDNLLPIIRDNDVNLLMPLDVVIAKEIKEGVENKVVSVESIPEGWKGVDIGPVTIEEFKRVIIESKTLFWNGPMGVFEIHPFDKGTREIAISIGEATKNGAITVVGGGDTDKAIEESGVELTHLSTGGGASLKFLSGEEMPAISVLGEGV